MQEQLTARVREFADDLTRLLNSTVTHGIRISSAEVDPTKYRIGCGITDKNPLRPELVGLTTGKKPAQLYLFAAHDLVLDDTHGRWLMVTRTTYSVQIGQEDGQGTLFSYDYNRGLDNGYPEAHFHIHAPLGKDYERVFSSVDRGKDCLSDLHFPVGGARHEGGIHYRPILEDIVEMLASERLVALRENWEQAVATGRKKYYESQLRAAIRRSPEIAQDALDRLAN